MLIFTWQKAFSTEYQFLQYRIGDGLNTDIIKCVAEDDWGFIWIGTDQGLLQYNGHKFISYSQATKSPFIKDFIRLKDGRLLVLDDLGLTEIINEIDTVYFKRILEGTRTPTDSTIWYPKSLYEDSKGNLWIGEPQSVVIYNGSDLQRLNFEDKYNSSSFIRSFSFVELSNNKILIASNNGGFFVFDLSTNKLTTLETNGLQGDVNHLAAWNGEIYVAGNDGLYKFSSIDKTSAKIVLVRSYNTISYIQPINEKDLLLCSFLEPAFIYDAKGNFENLPYDMVTVNQAFKSSSDDIWLSTEKGLVLLKSQIFKGVKTERETVYVESLVQGKDKTVYFLSKEHIRLYVPGAKEAKIFKVLIGGYYLSSLIRNDKLWASNASDILVYNMDGSLSQKFDFSKYGRFIFDMHLDKNGDIWLTQEASGGLKKIDRDNNIIFYGKEQGLNKELTVVRTNDTGIYVGTNSVEGYLYFKRYEDSVFTTISKPFEHSSLGDFRVEDIAFDSEDIWLATSVGLFRQTSQQIEKVELDDKFNNLLTKAVVCQQNTPYIWFANSYGLIQYNKYTGEYSVYDESHGFPSNTINSRSLLVNDDGIWVGTSNGIAYSHDDFTALKKTPQPYVIQFYADNRPYKYSTLSSTKLPSTPYLEMDISSPVYPGNKVIYQYKINGDSIWTSIPPGSLLTFSKLGSGHYNLSFRAKKFGNYTWSNPTHFEFTVQKEFYETLLFQIAVVLAAVMLIIGTRYITTRILRRRQEELERLVAERTDQLARTNKNLLERNRELDQFVYSTSHDLSAPLKSIRGLINIASYETDVEVQKELLQRMNTSVSRLEKFIRDVVSYSRNVRLEVKQRPILLKSLVEEVIEHISHIEYFPQIKFTVNINDEVVLKSDETRVRIILNNLISNAVKFQRIGEVDEPEVVITHEFENNKHKISVKDNGCGISEEHKEKIFDMFYRANTSSDGSGLGLYILKETVDKLGGIIEFKSEEDVGSEFIVRLS